MPENPSLPGGDVAEENPVGQIRKALKDAGLADPSPAPKAFIGSVLPAALASVQPDNPGADRQAAQAFGLDAASSVVVVLVDGLGEIGLRAHLAHAHTLRALAPRQGGTAQTVLPSTTAAALTTFGTGALPGTTNMVGYSVLNPHGEVMNLLNFSPNVAAEQWQPTPTFFETFSATGITPSLITKPKFASSGLTRAAFRGANFVGRESLEGRFDAALRGIAKGEKLQVVYWADIDHVGHGKGLGSFEWTAALEEFDAALGAFLKRLPKDVQVVMTADHGMVNVQQIIDVAQTPQLASGVAAIAGEGRAVHLHAKADQQEQVVERWRDYLEDKAVVVPASQLPEILGPGPGNAVVGTAMVFAKDGLVILDSATQKPSVFAMKGVHGSFTAREMTIPVWRLA